MQRFVARWRTDDHEGLSHAAVWQRAYPYEGILKMSAGNALIAAKVTLSVFRRGKRLLEFFLEGRVSYDKPSSQK
ncbi:hypothetical protein [Brevundimonas nasdae]|uniref:Transposase n=1 Tax=Brevundimonas nasdae TaxID=172043 RepID=A0ABX8TIF4_9CAUL|nr:hypothetical protein [Brevundimonas nasdae]QYC11033.1 hypothetical protein KWG56_03205 [Brevundimonas nasdae]QYC13819.1 hypothetical protein KWG63_16755 [Brevundimonas nasdae]